MDRRTMMIGTTLAAAFAAARALPHGTDKSKLLNVLFDRFMKENLDLSPLTVTNLGMDTGARATQKSEIDDGSEAGIERQKALIASQLARLTAFDRASLSASDAASYDVVMYGLRTTDTANRAFHYGLSGAGQPYVLSQISGSYQQQPSFLDTQHIVETKPDADAYIAPRWLFDAARPGTQGVGHDRAMGVTPPDFVLAKTLIQMQALRALPPEQSPLTTSVVRRAREKKIPGDYARLASRAVKGKIYPALERQIALVTEMQKKP